MDDLLEQKPVLIEQRKERLSLRFPLNLLTLLRLSSQSWYGDSKFEIMCFEGHQNSTGLNQARILLHDYYVRHLHWEIPENNPSGLHIRDQLKFQWIEDDYDLSARWFVLKDSKQVIACARLCFPDSQGLLEIARYGNACSVLNSVFETHKKNLVELNREAILMTHVNYKACYLLLLQAIFEYCLERQQVLLTTTNIKEWVKCYKRIGFAHQAAYQFKYFDHEKKPVNVYIAEMKDLENMLGVIQCQLKQFMRTNRAVSH